MQLNEFNLTIEVVFVELLWQRASDDGMNLSSFVDQTDEYQRIKNEIINDLKNHDTIELWFCNKLISHIISKSELNELLIRLTNDAEEKRMIERSIFIANQEAIHNEDELNDER